MQIRFSEYKTDGYINNFVHSFWKFENNEAFESSFTVLPDGYFSLTILFIKGKLTKVLLNGIHTGPTTISIPVTGIIFGIHFKLPASEFLFDKEYKPELNNSKILPLNFKEIDKITSEGFNEFMKLAQIRIRQDLLLLPKIDPRKLNLFRLIYQNKVTKIESLASDINWSTRQMNRYFSNNFNVTLKELMKIIRFRRNISLISENKFYPRTQYFDQSHFIREVKRYAGTTPSNLHKNRNNEYIQLLT